MESIRIRPIRLDIFQQKTRTIHNQRLLDKTRGDGGIVFPEEGGILTYFVGEKYPVRGLMLLADETILDVVDRVKAGFLRALRFTISRPLVFFLPLMLPFYKPILKSAIKQFADFVLKSLHNFYLTENRWCKSGREIYRVFKDKVKDKDQMWLLLTFLMVIEFSDGYRFRKQDILGEMDKKALRKNPRKELLRLMDLLIEREQREGMKRKWKDFRKPIILLMWIFRGKTRKLAEILAEIDIEKIRLDDQDFYHCTIRSDYNYRGLSFVERMRIRKQLDNN